jgi:hypothetical protein
VLAANLGRHRQSRRPSQSVHQQEWKRWIRLCPVQEELLRGTCLCPCRASFLSPSQWGADHLRELITCSGTSSCQSENSPERCLGKIIKNVPVIIFTLTPRLRARVMMEKQQADEQTRPSRAVLPPLGNFLSCDGERPKAAVGVLVHRSVNGVLQVFCAVAELQDLHACHQWS